jgi:YD repeat-containing protein
VKFPLAFVAGFILFFTGAWGAPAESSPMSDRDQKGLRGPVKTCVEETTYPAGVTAPDGTQVSEGKSSQTTEYDVAGRVLSMRFGNTDGSEWVSRYSYGASGQLLKIASGNEGEPSRETVYSYDDSGRPLKIIDGYTPDNPVTFRYDEQGRKTKVQISRPEGYRPNVGVAGSPFQAADMAPNLPGGGTATTVYDEHDRPIEVQVRDAHGELVSRALRIYDSQGRITEKNNFGQPRDALSGGIADRDGGSGRISERIRRRAQQVYGRRRWTIDHCLQL